MRKSPKKSTRVYCTARKFCPFLEARLNLDVNARAKGLTVIELTNMKAWARRVVGVAYKKSASDAGLMLSYCPWCGCNLITPKWPSRKVE